MVVLKNKQDCNNPSHFHGVTHVVILACNFHVGCHHSLHIYTSCVWSYQNQLFTMHHLGYYNLVSLFFGTTIPTSFNILMKCFLHFIYNTPEDYFQKDFMDRLLTTLYE